jgi:hypothetical protein
MSRIAPGISRPACMKAPLTSRLPLTLNSLSTEATTAMALRSQFLALLSDDGRAEMGLSFAARLPRSNGVSKYEASAILSDRREL